MNKADALERLATVGHLLFEAVHLLETEESYGDEDREVLIAEFLERCRQEGYV